MKIAIMNLTGKGMSGGYRKYLQNVIPRLAANPDVESLLCVSLDSLTVDKWFKPIKNVKFLNYSSYNFFSHKISRRSQQEIEQFSPDVIFVPVEKPVKFRNIPVVTMIQNMEPFTHDIGSGDPLSEKIKHRLQYMVGKIAVRKAARVIAISGFVRDFLVNTLHIPGDKIGLVYYGVSFEKNTVITRPEAIPLDWDGKFIFTAGSIRPARGLEDLVLAAKKIDFDSLGIKGVVIAGNAILGMLKYKNNLLDLIKANDLASRFIFLSEIDLSQMEWYYKNCWIFAMTSRVEACPNIALEAMAHGNNCVVADNPPLPEFFRDCAVYYKPKDAVSLAGAIASVSKWEESKKTAMAQKARARASEFSWEKTVNALINELQKVVGK